MQKYGHTGLEHDIKWHARVGVPTACSDPLDIRINGSGVLICASCCHLCGRPTKIPELPNNSKLLYTIVNAKSRFDFLPITRLPYHNITITHLVSNDDNGYKLAAVLIRKSGSICLEGL